MIITIDGPVASGKSSIAKALAKELSIYYLYTGLLYRAVAYVLCERLKDEKGGEITNDEFSAFVASLTLGDLGFVKTLSYDYGADGGEESRPYIFYQGDGEPKEITQYLHHASLDQPTSIVSTNGYVRASLLGLQRNIAEKYDIVADGRDCGTIVFPEADYKFYLTAEVSIRAERLMLDETRGGFGKNFEKVKAELEERDKRDKDRAVAPLTIPEGATIVDNSRLTQEETLEKFLTRIRQ